MSEIANFDRLLVVREALHVPSRVPPNSLTFEIPARDPVALDAGEVRELRDRLTEWLQRVGRDQ